MPFQIKHFRGLTTLISGVYPSIAKLENPFIFFHLPLYPTYSLQRFCIMDQRAKVNDSKKELGITKAAGRNDYYRELMVPLQIGDDI